MDKTEEDFEGRIINAQIKELKELFKNPDSFEEGKAKFLDFHLNCHRSEMSGQKGKTFEDLLWDGLSEPILRKAVTAKGRTILYGLWHSARIEDMTMNGLVSRKEQIYFSGDYRNKIDTGIDHTGNSLSSKEILEMSSRLNINSLCDYRIEVGKATRKIIKNLSFEDLKRKIDDNDIEYLRSSGSVDDVPSANWLLDFWRNKNVHGILFMPACRHLIVHLRESFDAKAGGLKNKDE
ncbi:MAG: DinB family protein [Spirochaetes bacterium]|nr:DinB family protein [Spirochaetota bacterium]MBN2771334.1 DinB family protein [Spirochaetota bacterium]